MSRAIRNAIIAKLNTIAGIGKVNAYQRYADDRRELEQMYVTDGVLLGWFISRGRVAEWQETLHKEATTWNITGFRAIVDGDESELLFDDLIDRMRQAFADDITLGLGHGLTTIYKDQVGLQLDDAGPVEFAGVLCHCAKLSLTTVTMKKRNKTALYRPLEKSNADL